MCGVVGFCDFSKKSTKETLKDMTSVLSHRGPDADGYAFVENHHAYVGLGHRRLSVLDLSVEANQPMQFENIQMIYNGEVYNYQEIKNELEEHGYNFESHSDTEVVLKAYHKWGIKSVEKFNGMFVIAVFDASLEKLVLIRDRAGVKPCYWYFKNDLFMFSSELKSFHQHDHFTKVIDKNALALYLQYGYVPQPYTIFKYSFKLNPGHYLEIDLKTKLIEEQKYWDVRDFYNLPKLDISETEAIDETEKILKSACEYRMISDVPIGVFLSGGYDSSFVTSILQSGSQQRLNTFTIGFYEKKFNEAPYAKEIANYLGTNHTEYYCTQKDALEIIPELCEIYDEPFGDSSALPTLLVSKLAKKDVTVSLSSDGGDEVFCGYSKYETLLKYCNNLSKIHKSVKSTVSMAMHTIDPKYIPFTDKMFNFETKYNKLATLLKVDNCVDMMKYTSQHITVEQIDKLLISDTVPLKTNFENRLIGNDCLDEMLAMDYQTYMVDAILTKVDRATMSQGLEGREPLLDYRIVEFVSQIPNSIKYKENQSKWLLKRISHKYLPKEMLERPKKGFSVPIDEWFKDDLKAYFLHYLSKERLDREGIFNTQEVIRLRDSYLKNDNEKANVRRLWFILMFEMWYEKWM